MSKPLKLITFGLVISLAVFLLVLQLPQFGLLLLIIPGLYIWLGFSLPTNTGYIAGSIYFVLTTLLVAHPFGMMVGLFGGLIPLGHNGHCHRDHSLR